jgi:hypothetical protein
MKTAKKSENLVDLESAISQAPGNGTRGEKSPSNAGSSSLARGATGPRTKEGKERSKYNALKHGIFSKIILLGSESRLEFNSVLNGLRNDLMPEGALEEILVEKLVSILWRYRRMLIAERAEIQRGTKYSGWDEFVHKDPQATIFLTNQGRRNKKPGLILGIENPVILGRCVEQLQLLKRLIETRGLEPDTDKHILEVVYGDAEIFGKPNLFTHYYSSLEDDWEIPTWAYKTQLGLSSEEEIEAYRVKSRQEELESKKTNFVKKLQEELNMLKTHAGLIEKVTAPKDELEELCRNVLEGPTLDRLLRHEASLERSFDRTLSQLERLQRMRLGQPVPPRIDVNLSSS